VHAGGRPPSRERSPGLAVEEVSMIINHNMSAIFAERQLKFNNLEAD
jgi:hypothetical protein